MSIDILYNVYRVVLDIFARLTVYTLCAIMRMVGEERTISAPATLPHRRGDTMPVSESKKKANAKWDSENMATVACKIKKSQAEKFKSYCSSIGKTSNAVIRDYVLECIDEKEPATGDNPTE